MSTDKVLLPRSGKVIGHGCPCFIVAEIGNNHQGDIQLARKLVHIAAERGVDAVKFQKRHSPSLLTREGMNAPYNNPNSFGKTYGEHREAVELSIEDFAELKALSESLGLVFFASAWDMHSLRELIELDVEIFKVASADLVNVPMLRRMGEIGMPVILSTGMSGYDDIDRAVAELKAYHEDIVILHCNSTYPCPEEDIALPVMYSLRKRYGLPVGYSGHEVGLGPSVGAAALGACVIERHITLDKAMRGSDHKASLNPDQLGQLVQMIREVERSMSRVGKTVSKAELNCAGKLRKSVVFARDLPKGAVISESDITAKSPGTGVSPMHWDEIVGCVLTTDVSRDQMFAWSQVQRAADLQSLRDAGLGAPQIVMG